MAPMDERTTSHLAAGFDPRQQIQRDPFNELFVFVLSAAGAAVLIPVAGLVLFQFTPPPSIVEYALGAIAAELILIFGIVRPAMKPIEKLGWAALWTFSTLFFAVCFYVLVLT